MYKCAACGNPVSVINGVVTKACHCAAPIVALMQAKAHGVGGAKSK